MISHYLLIALFLLITFTVYVPPPQSLIFSLSWSSNRLTFYSFLLSSSFFSIYIFLYLINYTHYLLPQTLLFFSLSSFTFLLIMIIFLHFNSVIIFTIFVNEQTLPSGIFHPFLFLFLILPPYHVFIFCFLHLIYLSSHYHVFPSSTPACLVFSPLHCSSYLTLPFFLILFHSLLLFYPSYVFS